MADETETPTPTSSPAPPRRRTRSTKPAAAKNTAAKPESDTPAPKRTRTPRKPAAKAESGAEPAKSESKPKRTRAPAKPRAAKRPTPASKRRKSAQGSTVDKAADKVGGKWGAAAIATGVAAVGAAAALFSLRGSTRKPVTPGPTGSTKPVPVGGAKSTGGAHTADGTDASKSFQAGIADENTIPDA